MQSIISNLNSSLETSNFTTITPEMMQPEFFMPHNKLDDKAEQPLEEKKDPAEVKVDDKVEK
jgi:hypothetical protein